MKFKAPKSTTGNMLFGQQQLNMKTDVGTISLRESMGNNNNHFSKSAAWHTPGVLLAWLPPLEAHVPLCFSQKLSGVCCKLPYLRV